MTKTFAVRATAVSSWGGNDAGELGNGTTVMGNVPVLVSGLTGAVSVGSRPRSNPAFAVH